MQTRSKTAAALVVSLSMALGAVACRDNQAGVSPVYPRIVLVSLDTMSIEYSGPYNPEVKYTPTLDEIAGEGVVFEYAYSPVGLTLPAHATLLTGNSPATTKVLANGDTASDDLAMLSETLSSAGYRTAAYVSLGVLKATFGLSQGFDTYGDDVEKPARRWYGTADEVVDAAIPWVSSNAKSPFFLWVHLSDPHMPYLPKDAPPDAELSLDGKVLSQWTLGTRETYEVELSVPPGSHELTWSRLWNPDIAGKRQPHVHVEVISTPSLSALVAPECDNAFQINRLKPTYSLPLENQSSNTKIVTLRFTGRESNMNRRELVRRYEIEVEFMDHHLGRLRDHFRSEGLADDTLWIVVSDHGEGLGSHGVGGHAGWVYDNQLRMLWFMSGPELPTGKVVRDTPARTEDVVPTIFDLLGMSPKESLDGRSLVDCWSRPCEPPGIWKAHNVSHTDRQVVGIAVYDWPLKWLRHEKRGAEAYDVLRDAAHTENLLESSDSSPDRFEALAQIGSSHHAALSKQMKKNSRNTPAGEALEILKALDYL